MSNEITDERAKQFGVNLQREGESDTAYRDRVATAIRKQGAIIEAHEARTNMLYDDPNNKSGMLGIMGAVAQTMQNRHYDGDPIGNDLAAGVVATSKRRDDDLAALFMAMLLSK